MKEPCFREMGTVASAIYVYSLQQQQQQLHYREEIKRWVAFHGQRKEDQLLRNCIEQYGEGKWHRVPLLAGLNRCRKSCRLRWLNYLRPNIKRGSFEEEEVDLIIKLHKLLGNRWSLVAARLPGRTGNDVKNYWNCHLSKKLNAQETEDKNKHWNVQVMRPRASNYASTSSKRPYSTTLDQSPSISARFIMAYIPPHKRHSKETERPLPTPELLAPQFKKKLILRSSKSNADWDGKVIYANHARSRWCIIGLDDENQFPSSVNLEPISLETTERRTGEKPLALINASLDKEGSEVKWYLPKSPWVSLAENVLEDLLSSFENVKNDMKCPKLEEVKPSLVARVGKVLFQRSPSVNMESIRNNLDTEVLKQWKRLFYTNLPVSYKENILKEVVPNIGVDFEEEKDVYHVKLSDSTRPDSILSCKCSVMKEHGKLQLYKIELNQLRDMVIDISCPNKNLDLRVMLCTKRLVTALTDDEMQSIRDLISSAVLDPDVKGGLRWPLGKESSGDRYKVVGIWHVIANMYANPSLRLKVRHADRFDFRTSTGEATWEVSLMLKKVVSKLQEEKVEVSSISEILEENMRMIWDNFLCSEHFLI
ncbi:uncharacterized protein Pyn_24127 [Prunus yedoensis var. nudiflora]|uniref:Uncharacterized protein n=1 Tax=Prunus yedoensis var. nudiflora TaxID=2094558 RepID=A0A314ZW59_PRUYE|nr:uncharacterized protein Pyn_24127 [Prunus yedoensis var. nudiflora]